MLRPRISLSLATFLALVVAGGFAIGHGWTATGIAFFLFVLACIDAKPSWKRIFDPDPKREGGILRWTTFKGVDPARPNERTPPERP